MDSAVAHVRSFTADSKTLPAVERRWPVFRDALIAWLAQRIAFAILFLLAAALFGGPGHSPPGALSPRALDNPWLNWWDSGHFFRIAARGYSDRADAVFDPLYPLGIGLIRMLTGGNVVIAAALVSNVACFGAMALVRVLAAIELGPRAARWTLVFFTFQPAAIYMAMTYSESLFLMLAAAALIAIRRERWLAAAGLSALATLTRSAGLLLIVPVAMQAVRRWIRRRKRAPLLAATLAVAVSLAAYLLFRFVLAQTLHVSQTEVERDNYSRYLDWPWVGALQAFGVLFHPDTSGANWNALYDLSITAWCGVLVVVLLSVQPLRAVYGVYALAGYVALLSLPMHGPSVGEDLNGLPRYLMMLLPVWLGLAAWSGRAPWRRALALSTCVAGFSASAFFVGHPPLVL